MTKAEKIICCGDCRWFKADDEEGMTGVCFYQLSGIKTSASNLPRECRLLDWPRVSREHIKYLVFLMRNLDGGEGSAEEFLTDIMDDLGVEVVDEPPDGGKEG